MIVPRVVNTTALTTLVTLTALVTLITPASRAAAQDEPGIAPLVPASQPLSPTPAPEPPSPPPGPATAPSANAVADEPPMQPPPAEDVVAPSSPRWVRGYGVVSLALGLPGSGALSIADASEATQDFDTEVQPGFRLAGYYAPRDYLHLGVFVLLLHGGLTFAMDTPSDRFSGTGSTTTFCAGAGLKLGGAIGPVWIGFAGDIGVGTWTAEAGNSFIGLALFPRLVLDTWVLGSHSPGFKLGLSAAVGALAIPTATTSQEIRTGPHSVYVDYELWKVQPAITVGLLFGG